MSRLYSIDDLAWIARRLELIPIVLQSEKSLRTCDAVDYLFDAIADQREFGFSLASVAQRLTTLGLPIRVRTLENYLRRARRSRGVALTTTAATDSTVLDFDIDVDEEPVVDERFERWFRRG